MNPSMTFKRRYLLKSCVYIFNLQVRELSLQHNLVLHLDGARLFNAATALKVPPAEITQYCDSVSTAFSKVCTRAAQFYQIH